MALGADETVGLAYLGLFLYDVDVLTFKHLLRVAQQGVFFEVNIIHNYNRCLDGFNCSVGLNDEIVRHAPER